MAVRACGASTASVFRSASAVLATLNPSAWPVIDRWAMKALFTGPPRVLNRRDQYRSYLLRLAELQREVPSQTIHAVDIVAMQLGVSGEPPPFPKVPLT